MVSIISWIFIGLIVLMGIAFGIYLILHNEPEIGIFGIISMIIVILAVISVFLEKTA